MTQPARIVVVGSLVFDFVARAPRLPRRGETILGDFFGMFPGGKGANQAVQAGRLGAEVSMVGRVGADPLGDQLIASLQASHVRTDWVRRDSQVSTAACCIHLDAEGGNSIVIVPAANQACSPADVDAAQEVIDRADVVLCQLEIPLATVEHTLERAARARVPVILNPAPAQPLPASWFPRIAYLTPNEIEAEMLTNAAALPLSASEPAEWAAGRRLSASGAANVIITLGERGAYVQAGELQQWLPAFPVQAIDTTAAGDAFNGALAVALAERQPLEQAVRFANAAGALATTRLGAQPAMPTRAEVESLLRTHPSPTTRE